MEFLPGLEAGKLDAKRRSRQAMQHFTEILAGTQVEPKPPPHSPSDIYRGFRRRFRRSLIINPGPPRLQVQQGV